MYKSIDLSGIKCLVLVKLGSKLWLLQVMTFNGGAALRGLGPNETL
jgi:hypothetical protein